MDAFPAALQPDEGYSEDPLNPQDSTLSHGMALSGLSAPADLPAWLTSHLPNLPLAVKTRKFCLTSGLSPLERDLTWLLGCLLHAHAVTPGSTES